MGGITLHFKDKTEKGIFNKLLEEKTLLSCMGCWKYWRTIYDYECVGELYRGRIDAGLAPFNIPKGYENTTEVGEF